MSILLVDLNKTPLFRATTASQLHRMQTEMLNPQPCNYPTAKNLTRPPILFSQSQAGPNPPQSRTPQSSNAGRFSGLLGFRIQGLAFEVCDLLEFQLLLCGFVEVAGDLFSNLSAGRGASHVDHLVLENYGGFLS